jgi:hypothetical protein
MSEMQEYFYRTARQDRTHRVLEWGTIGIVIGGLIYFAPIVSFLPVR